MNLIPFAIVWVVMVLAILSLVVYRKKLAGTVDEGLHVTQHGDTKRQADVVGQLEKLDRLGKILTVLVVVYTLAVAGAFLYLNFTSPALG